MQEQVHIDPHLPVEKVHVLCVVELRLQQVVQWHLGVGTGDHHVAAAAVNGEHSNFVAGDGQVHSIPLSLGVALPRHQDTAIGQGTSRVLVGAKLEHLARFLKLALVIPLLGEWHQESLLSLLVLQRDHGLFNVVVVGFELLIQVEGLVVKAGRSQPCTFQLSLSLDSSAVFGPDVNSDGIQEILVVVVPSDLAVLLEKKDILKSGALELRVAHRSDVDQGAGFTVGTSSRIIRVQLLSYQHLPPLFIFVARRLDHDIHQVGTGLDSDDVENAPLSFHKQCLHLRFWICDIG